MAFSVYDPDYPLPVPGYIGVQRVEISLADIDEHPSPVHLLPYSD